MGAIGKKLRSADMGDGTRGVAFWCPGCKRGHVLRISPTDQRPSWEWNGDGDAPTFSPSVLVRFGGVTDCHSFVTAGHIQFLGDSTHALAGQTVDLPDWPATCDWYD